MKGLFAFLRKHLLAHGFVAKNAASLYASTVVTSALGFGFWSLAAHLLSPAQVGDGSAVVSAMQLVAMLCVVGLNTLIISEVSVHPARTRTLVATAGVIVTTLGAVGGLATALLLRATSAVYVVIFGAAWAVPIFVVGVALTTLTLVTDDACVAARRPALQFSRNTVFATAKLALIPAAAILMPHGGGVQLLAVWVIGIGLSLWFIRGLIIAPRAGSDQTLFDFGLIRSHGHLALRHHWLNVSVQVPRLAIPAIAAVVIGPRLTAAFYAALLMVGFVSAIPNLLTLVLFALTAGDEIALREQVRFTLALSGLLAVVSAPAIYLVGGFGLSLFAPTDLTARTAMWVLGLTVAPLAIKAHFVIVSRIRDQMGRAARLTTWASAVEVGCAAAGGWRGGVTGMAIGWLMALVLEAVLFAPVVYRAAVASGESRQAA